MVQFRGNRAYLTGIAEHQAPGQVGLFDRWVQKANEDYVIQLQREAADKDDQERAALATARRTAEARARVLKRLPP